jgi:glyoxylate/hydroxypyruvate reductase A
MALLFQSPDDRFDWWQSELEKRLPEIEIRSWPECGDADEIEFALIWKPPHGMLAGFPNLRAILSMGAGVDHIFADPQLPKDIPIARVVDRALTAGMVEYGLGAVLAAHRRFPEYLRQQRAGQWQALGYRTASETCVGILGFGVIGSALGEACTGLGYRVIGWARSAKAHQAGDDVPVCTGEDGLQEILSTAHILVCLLPKTAETIGILDKRAFGAMRAGAWLVNMARGDHVVDTDLIEALDSGHLSGAFLDVFSQEPLPPEHPFWGHPKINLTPHIASVTDPRSVADQVSENVRRTLDGLPLLNEVNPERGY